MASKIKIKFKEKRNDVILVQDRISKSSKHSLRPALRARRITPWSTGIQPFPKGSIFINFGGGALPVSKLPEGAVVLNPPAAIANSANKLRTFELLQKANVQSVRWTASRLEAEKWFGKGHKVLSRLSLSSSGGRGIHVAREPSELREAPLYTRYFPKTHEFRVHVVGGVAVDLVEKKIRNDLKEDKDNRVIRNHRNGWVFAHGGISLGNNADLDAIRRLGVDAIRAVGLDFGAADILAILGDGNPRRLKIAVVCEVNAAPGIENTQTEQAYVRALNKLIETRLGK